MTDYDTDILRERESPLPAPQVKKEQRASPDKAMLIALDDRANLAPAVEREKADDSKDAKPAEGQPERDRMPAKSDPDITASPAVDAAGQASADDQAEKSRDEKAVAARRRTLALTMAHLLRLPEETPLAGLFEVYAEASDREIAEAATALLSLYLRTETETRRRLRPVLSKGIQSAGKTALALALSAKLGAIAMPRHVATAEPASPDRHDGRQG